MYLIGDIEKDTARGGDRAACASWPTTTTEPITLYINSAGGNVTDGLAIHDSIRQIVARGIEVTIIVQGMAYRWDRSCCRRQATGGGCRCRTRGS